MKYWIGICFLVVSGMACVTTGRAQDNNSGPNDPERFVREKANLGQPAVFPAAADPKKRTIRSRFIENLLTGADKTTKLTRQGLIIENAIFEGPLNLRSVSIPVEVRWTHCRFNDSVDFSESRASAPFVFDWSEFTNSAATLNFNGMTVDANLSLDNVQVSGDAQFYHLDVKGDLFVRISRFTNSQSAVQFGQAKVKGKMFFDNSRFQGSLSLADTEMLGLDLKGASIQGALDLNHAHIQTVFDLGLTTFPSSVALEGLNYADLTGPDVGRQLIELIDKANYNAQSYMQLEGYYRTHAYPELADETFFRMKRQERKRLSFGGQMYGLLLYVLVGYGRTPQNALYISFIFVVLGAFIFWDKRSVVPRNPEDPPKQYRPFWYSFDLLTPFIDLHEADSWMPRQDWWWGTTYAHLHRIIGWILVPVGIAAISGIIK
jgi:hypothetical protein